MAYRFRERYQAMLGKRQHLRDAEAYSVRDDVGAKVAILVPFMEELIFDERDSRENFEKQTAELMEHYEQLGREPYYVMGATPADFEDAMSDRSVATVVVEGCGNFSATSVPISKDRRHDTRYAYLDWQHLAGMATHLKLGSFVMYTCCILDRAFNAPLAAGVVSSHADIRAPTGKAIYATGMEANEPLMQPITTKEELDYDEVKRLFPLKRNWDVPPVVPDPAYVAARGIYNRFLNPNMPEIPERVTIPYPDLREYL